MMEEVSWHVADENPVARYMELENVKHAGLLYHRDHAVCKQGEKRVLRERSSPSFRHILREARLREEDGSACDGGSCASMKTTKLVAIDEDLYKIPPELIFHCQTKRKRVLGFYSRCLAPACTA